MDKICETVADWFVGKVNRPQFFSLRRKRRWVAGGSLCSLEPRFISGVNNSALTGLAAWQVTRMVRSECNHLLSSYWLAARLPASNWLSEAAMT